MLKIFWNKYSNINFARFKNIHNNFYASIGGEFADFRRQGGGGGYQLLKFCLRNTYLKMIMIPDNAGFAHF